MSCYKKKVPDKTLLYLSQRLKTQDYPMLMKRLDQSSVTINLKNGSQELTDLVQILKVHGFEEIVYFNL